MTCMGTAAPASKEMPAEGLARKLNKTLGPPQFQLSVWGREVLLSLASAWTEKGFKENRRKQFEQRQVPPTLRTKLPKTVGKQGSTASGRTGGKLQGPDRH